MHKNKLLILSFLLLFTSCSNSNNKPSIDTSEDESSTSQIITSSEESSNEQSNSELVSSTSNTNINTPLLEEEKLILNNKGYVEGKIPDFSVYENTSSYVKVDNAQDFLNALEKAKYTYKSSYNSETNSLEQVLEQEGTIHVIEITKDIDMGYYTLTNQGVTSPLLVDFASKVAQISPYYNMSSMFNNYGISQIKVENTSNLLIYSRNGNKLTHCGFKLTSDTNVCFRNLSFDEIWQWEDTSNSSNSKTGDYDAFGWAYFKISFCEYIYIDHCTFGKSYDGQIDVSNPFYMNTQTAFRAPYGAKGENGVHISFCKFNAGSDDKNGYIYKMMEEIEEDYLHGEKKNLLYKTLRDKGATFEEILYGVSLPQKKGFLFGDNSEEEYTYNKNIRVSFFGCVFKNLEDRIPKLRGGNCYMASCLVDSLEYLTYRKKLISKNCKFSSPFKCALVSQGILVGNGGSFYMENSSYKGVDSFLKNNDSAPGGNDNGGGYKIVNSIYQKDSSSAPIKGNSEDNIFKVTSGNLTIDKFAWINNTKPFEPKLIEVEKLEEKLLSSNLKAGTNNYLSSFYLK